MVTSKITGRGAAPTFTKDVKSGSRPSKKAERRDLAKALEWVSRHAYKKSARDPAIED